jgi:hypothetical protein
VLDKQLIKTKQYKEIDKIQRSGVTGRKIAAAIEPLQQRLRDLKKDDENQITY